MQTVETSLNQKKSFSLLSFTRPYRKYFILAVLFIVIECSLEISIPFLSNILLRTGLVRDDAGAITGIDYFYLYLIAGIMVLFAIAAAFLGVFTAKFTAKVGRGLGYELRKEEYKKIQSFSFSNLDDFRINSLITRITNDVQIISDTFCQVLRPLLRAPIQLVFSLAFALIMSKELSIVFLVILPILAILLITIIMLTRPLFVKLQGSLDRINRTTQESLIAMKLIRANAKKDYEIEKFTNVNNEVRSIGNTALGINALNMGVMQMMTYACVICILFFGANLAISKESVAEETTMITSIVSFLDYVMQTLASLIMLSNVFMIFTRASASSQRLKEVFSAESEILDKKDSTLEVTKGAISFENVYFKYKKQASEYVLSDINLEIKDGEFVGIIGQTGSSKSTLVYLIERFYDVDSGVIKIDGNNIQDYSLDELRRSIAISFQSPRLFTGTVKDNLLWGNPNATMEEIIEACQIAGCYDFILHKLPNGFDTEMGQTGSNVSGGQRQRLCIARALLRKPKILILDDSFSALDRITEAEVKKNLRERLPHMTTIVISQKVSTIHDADKIVVLKDGMIHGIGQSEALIESDEIYRNIYQIQTEGK